MQQRKPNSAIGIVGGVLFLIQGAAVLTASCEIILSALWAGYSSFGAMFRPNFARIGAELLVSGLLAGGSILAGIAMLQNRRNLSSLVLISLFAVLSLAAMLFHLPSAGAAEPWDIPGIILVVLRNALLVLLAAAFFTEEGARMRRVCRWLWPAPGLAAAAQLAWSAANGLYAAAFRQGGRAVITAAGIVLTLAASFLAGRWIVPPKRSRKPACPVSEDTAELPKLPGEQTLKLLGGYRALLARGDISEEEFRRLTRQLLDTFQD